MSGIERWVSITNITFVASCLYVPYLLLSVPVSRWDTLDRVNALVSALAIVYVAGRYLMTKGKSVYKTCSQ